MTADSFASLLAVARRSRKETQTEVETECEIKLNDKLIQHHLTPIALWKYSLTKTEEVNTRILNLLSQLNIKTDQRCVHQQTTSPPFTSYDLTQPWGSSCFDNQPAVLGAEVRHLIL